MNNKKIWQRVSFCLLGLIFLLAACNLPSAPAPEVGGEPTPTPTPTTWAVSENNRCPNLSGTIEVQVTVGPAEVVGLEPVAVGQIPFSVGGGSEPYVVSGSGSINYLDVLIEEWGTYTVTLDMQVTISGVCEGPPGAEVLRLTITLDGEQLVVVEAQGFSGQYPWAGVHNFEFVFPLVDGTAMAGEGWVFVLHLDN
ncbi:MAG: hypothetical protein ABIJ39_11350 [Chloroflexota bacterium]